MKNFKSLLIITVLCITALGIIFFNRVSKAHKQTRFTIGILQTASHPALDAARDGFINELTQSTGSDVTFIVRNGEGSIANIHTIAQQFHNDNSINAIFAIATPAAQAIATVEKNKPIVIAAVTDPSALGLSSAKTNISGIKDMINVPAAIDLLINLLPHAKNIGLMYNNGEANSVILTTMMQKELEKRGLTPLNFAVNNESDLPTAAQMAFLKSDAVLTPTDNMVASSINLLTTLAQNNKKPLIVSDNMLVTHGALASRGVDYQESGKEAAEIAYKILVEHNKPHELPITQAHSNKIFINKDVLKSLALAVPQGLDGEIILVGK